MDPSRNKAQIKLTVFENEPLARLAEQRLQQESIPCLVRCLDAGAGGWGVANNLPHAIYVKAGDQMRAHQVLDLLPAEIGEMEWQSSRPTYRPSIKPVAVLIIMSAALLFGVVELVINRLIR